MRYIISLFFISVATLLQGQISTSEKVVDYGDITVDTELEKELFFINTGSSKSLLLTTDFPREYSAHISSKEINPGDTVYLRWKFTPFSEGSFKDEITIWFSTMTEPIALKVKGNVKYIDPYGSPACPNFNERPAGMERSFLTDFVVLDKQTKKPISKAHIKVVDSGVVLADLTMNRFGEKSVKMPIRYYYFLAESAGFTSVDLYSYVNSKNHRFVFELDPIAETPAVPNEEILVEEIEPEIIIPPVVEIVAEEKEPDAISSEVEIPEAEKGEFSSSDFKANNIVFLVDVSGSMNSNGRLDLLKASMIEMVMMMRAEDRISLVSYARTANTLLEPTNGMNKDEIIKQIRALTPAGSTSGEKGLKRAYSTAKAAFIKNGNNRVYIATDGVFKVSENKAIEKTIRKNTKKKIYLSILGIKGTNFTNKKMGELAAVGKGSFIALEDFSLSGGQLKSLIKQQSKK